MMDKGKDKGQRIALVEGKNKEQQIEATVSHHEEDDGKLA
jgi:hypothetical protein